MLNIITWTMTEVANNNSDVNLVIYAAEHLQN